MPRERYSRGSITKSKAKPQKWLGEWHVYREVDGKEKRVHRGPKVLGLCSKLSKTDAQAKLDAIIARERSAQDQQPPDEAKTVEWMFRRYRDLKKGKWAAATAEIFDWILEHRIRPALGAMLLTKITRADCQLFLNELAEQGQSGSQIGKCRVYLKAVFDEAIEADLIVKNPARKLDLPRTKKEKCSRFHTEEECARLLAACQGRDHLILRLCMVCGLRPGELFALRRNDIAPGRLRIDETSRRGRLKPYTKTEGSKGWVNLPANLEMEMRAYLETLPGEPDELLFPNADGDGPIAENNYRGRVLRPLAKAAGVKGVNFQSLRRTTGTHAAEIGSVKDVQGILRHATPTVTFGIYAQVIPASQSATSEALDEKLCGSKEIVQ